MKAQARSRMARLSTIRIVRLPHAEGLALPQYATEGAAGMDLVAAVAATAPVTIEPGARALVPTGLVFELPPATEAQVRPRSGLALRHGVTVLNTPGTIDCDYRGEVQVILVNLGDKPFVVARGDRIAQLVVQPVMRCTLSEAGGLTASQRGAGGFGSTGVASPSPAQKGKPSRKPTKSRKATAKRGG